MRATQTIKTVPMAVSARSNGVSGTRYLVHLYAGDSKTFCGRWSASVHLTNDSTPREELCKACDRAITRRNGAQK